ncbi:MAG: histidinol-phosphate transaminase [Eubacteriales bacterium]|jgi:histidinol-phosphate aminotransferase
MSRYAIPRVQTLTPYTANPNVYPVKLDANESVYPIDDALRQKVAQALLEDGLNIYPDPMAEQLCRAYEQLMGLPAGRTAAGNGSDELIHVIQQCYLDAGDTLLCFGPDFSMYRFYAEVLGARVEEVMKGEDLCLTPQMVKQAYDRVQPQMICFSNPCNPTGQGMSREEIRQIVEQCPCMIVVDEAYMDFWNQSVMDLVDQYDNLIVLRTCSKAFALAGIRLGFAVAEPSIIQDIQKVKSPYNVSVLTQIAGQVCLENAQYMKEDVERLMQERDWFQQKAMELAAEFPGLLQAYASHANFVLFSSPKAQAITQALLEEGICIRVYGGPRFRVTVGTHEQMQQILCILRSVLQQERSAQ